MIITRVAIPSAEFLSWVAALIAKRVGWRYPGSGSLDRNCGLGLSS